VRINGNGGANDNSLNNVVGIIKLLSGEVLIGRIKSINDDFILVETQEKKIFIVNKKAISYIEVTKFK